MKKRGGKREGAGRKSKAQEQKLIEKLTPLEDSAHKALKTALITNEPWAVKLYFEYMYGKPLQRTDVTTGGDKIKNPPAIVFSQAQPLDLDSDE